MTRPQTEDHANDERVAVAAEWLSATEAGAHCPTVPTVRERFGLSATDAVEAIRRAQSLRWGRAT